MKRVRQNISAAIVAIVSLAATSCTQCPNPTNIKFGDLTLSIDHSTTSLLYTLTKCEQGEECTPLLENSPIAIEINDELVEWTILGCTPAKTVDDSFTMITGEQKSVDLQYVEKSFHLSGTTASDDEIGATLTTRLYDSSFAYRLEIENEGDYTIRELSEYIFADTTGGCYAPNGEREPFGDVALSDFTKQYTTPVIYRTDAGVVAFHEADLHNYPQLYISSNTANGLRLSAESAEANGTMTLPWRVVLTGKSIADLHSSKQIYLSLAQPAEGDFSWVKPGFSTWDWRVKGCTFGGEMYEMTTNSLKRYIDFCARHGLEYFLIDAEWYDDENPIVSVEGLDLEEVIRYGNEIGVGTLVYYDLQYLKIKGAKKLDFDEVCAKFHSWGAKGIKYGFLGLHGKKLTSQGKVAECEYLIKTAAKHQLIIDFHDNPIPHGGLERQYPNYISREYCHAQMDRRWSFTPDQFTMMACVNLLAGPMDQTNGTYALNTIKSRSKGPRNEYNSTVAAETARAFITHTGNLSVLLDAPEAYEAFGDIFEFIPSMPNHWDEAKYLEMAWGEKIAIARREGEKWFLGVVYGNEGGTDVRSLDFLDPNKRYSAIIYRDAPTTDFKLEKESYEVERVPSISAKDKLHVKVANGGGYTVRFIPN